MKIEILNEKEFLDSVGNYLGLKVLRRVIQTSPVVTGRLRTGYNLGKEESGYYIYNNVAYSPRIEYGFIGRDSLGRLYHQKPQKIVRNAIKYVLGE